MQGRRQAAPDVASRAHRPTATPCDWQTHRTADESNLVRSFARADGMAWGAPVATLSVHAHHGRAADEHSPTGGPRLVDEAGVAGERGGMWAVRIADNVRLDADKRVAGHTIDMSTLRHARPGLDPAQIACSAIVPASVKSKPDTGKDAHRSRVGRLPGAKYKSPGQLKRDTDRRRAYAARRQQDRELDAQNRCDSHDTAAIVGRPDSTFDRCVCRCLRAMRPTNGAHFPCGRSGCRTYSRWMWCPHRRVSCGETACISRW